MPPSGSELEAIRQRLSRVYDSDVLGELAHELAQQLDGHFKMLLSKAQPVLNWRPPQENLADAKAILDDGASQSWGADSRDDAFTPRFRELLQEMLHRGQNLHHPRYTGHQVPASVPIAGLFDALGSVTNQVMAVYEMGPWSTAIELVLIDELAQRIGWEPGTCAGVITHGGSLANLTALLTARNVALQDVWESGIQAGPQPVLVVHGEAHYCVMRAAGVLGIGTRNIVQVGLDDRRRMDPIQLDAQLSDLRAREVPIIAVSASACSTPIGAFDPLPEIAKVCQKHGVWLHVDAAHGGGTLFSEDYRHLLNGIEQADSIVVDAHKMLFVPALCAFVLYKNAEHRNAAFHQNAPYLFDPSAPELAEYDLGTRSLECTKRAAGFGLWGIWSLFGPGLFADLVNLTFAQARNFHEMLVDAPDFEVLHEPEANIVAFRYRPAIWQGLSNEELGLRQLQIRRRIIESGAFYFVATQLDGIGTLRAVFMNPMTQESDLSGLLEAIRKEGAALS